MKKGDKILVLPSYALIALKLQELAGKEGVIVEINRVGNTINGCWVDFEDPYMEEKEWYIPYESIAL